MLSSIPLYQSIKAALTEEIIKRRMESNRHDADILTEPERLGESLLGAAARFVFLSLSYIFMRF